MRGKERARRVRGRRPGEGGRAAGLRHLLQPEVCSAHSRLLVERPVKDEPVERIAALAERYRPGDPLDPESGMGALVDVRHADRVMSFVDAAKAEARLVTGGERVRIGASDAYVAPTVFDDVPAQSALALEEVFGPVLAVTAFDTEHEAVAPTPGRLRSGGLPGVPRHRQTRRRRLLRIRRKEQLV